MLSALVEHTLDVVTDELKEQLWCIYNVINNYSLQQHNRHVRDSLCSNSTHHVDRVLRDSTIDCASQQHGNEVINSWSGGGSAWYYGGGISVHGDRHYKNSIINIYNSVISNNQIFRSRGGGIYMFLAVGTIINTTIDNNQAPNFDNENFNQNQCN